MSNSLTNLIDRSGLSQLNGQFDHTAPRSVTSPSSNLGTNSTVSHVGQNFSKAKRDRLCPICKASDWCMIGDILVLCHRSLVPAAGWKPYTKRNPVSGLYFMPDVEYKKPQTPKPVIRPFSFQADVAKVKAPPSVQDKIYRQIIGRSTLNEFQFEMLENRGLSDQAINHLIEIGAIGNKRSVGGFVVNPSSYVYGVDENGDTSNLQGLWVSALRKKPLISQVDGEPEYQILGGQIRSHDHILADLGKADRPKYGKYLALGKSGSSQSQKTGDTFESPLTGLACGHVTRVYICEGLLKAAIIYAKLWDAGVTNFMVIGSAGSIWGAKELLLHLDLNNAVNAEIVFLPDGGAIHNPNVLREIAKVAMAIPTLQVGWWGQLEKGGTDPDEISSEIFNSMKISHWQDSALASSLNEYILVNVSNIDGTEFNRLLEANSCVKDVKVLYARNANELAEIVNNIQAIDSNIRFIQVLMETGSGKSHAIAMYNGLVWLLTNDPYNPGTPEIAGEFAKRPAPTDKRALLTNERNGAGELRNVRISKELEGTEYNIIDGNCVRAAEKRLLLDLGMNESICKNCPFNGKCTTTTGWYLYEFVKHKDSPKIICSPKGLPPVTEETKSYFEPRTIVLDDVDPYATDHTEIKVNLLRKKIPEALKSVYLTDETAQTLKLILEMSEISKGKEFGLDAFAGVTLASRIKSVPVCDIELAHSLDLDYDPDYEGKGVRIDTGRKVVNPDGTVSWVKGQNAGWEGRMVIHAAEQNRLEQAQGLAESGWLGSIVNQLFKSDKPMISFDKHGNMHIDHPDLRLEHAIRSSKLVVWNDATGGSVKELMLVHGFKPSEIVIVKSPPSATPNIKVVLLQGLPEISKKAQDDENLHRVISVAAKLRGSDSVFSIPKWLPEESRKQLICEGSLLAHHFAGTRAYNGYTKKKTFIALSSFKINRGALATRFAHIHGVYVDSSIQPDEHPNLEWRQFCVDAQAAEYRQWMGRARAQRRAGEMITYYSLAPLSEDVVRSLRLSCPGVEFVKEYACNMDGYIPTATQAEQMKLRRFLYDEATFDNNARCSQQFIARSAGVTIDVLRGFLTSIGGKENRVNHINRVRDEEMWSCLNSALLGYPALAQYDNSDIEYLITEPTKRAIENSYASMLAGANLFSAAKEKHFRLAQELFQPYYPDRFAQIFLGEAPPITDDPDWDVEIPIDHITDSHSATTRTEPPIAA
jgi:hypothetical protein